MDSPQAVSISRPSDLLRKVLVGGSWVLLLFVASWCQAQDDDDDDPVETLKELNLAIQRNPQRADAYVKRGIFLRDVGEDFLAVKDFSEAIRLESNNAATFILRGM